MLKIWFVALRPWSFTASAIPVVLGTALAWVEGMFDPVLFLLALIGGIAMQGATNLINTYGDYKSGVDTVESAVTCPQLVTGALQPESMKRAGILVFGLAAAIGLFLAYRCGWEVLAVGMVGLAGGYCYTAGWYPYKYRGLGSIVVFFLMGPLMVWPAYFIQTGGHSWLPLLVSLPVGFLVMGILHANDLRDIDWDRRAGIKTLVTILGLRHSILLYHGLYAAAYLCLAAVAWQGLVPWTATLPLLLVPMIARVHRSLSAEGDRGRQNLVMLEAQSAKVHFQFGLLMSLGFVISPWISGWLS